MTHHEKMALTYYKQVDKECPTLAQYSRNLNLLYLTQALDPCYHREAYIDQIQKILLRKSKANVLLTGVAGCGKTALVGGTKYRGDFEDRLQKIVEECRNHPNVILFVDEVHRLTTVGKAEGSESSAQALKPALVSFMKLSPMHLQQNCGRWYGSGFPTPYFRTISSM